jgi:hypothetical protein
MEIVCRHCEGNAFRISPEDVGTVIAECVVCGTLTLIEIPKPSVRSYREEKGLKDHHCQPANGHRRDESVSTVTVDRR